jgi:hypothetical protein
LGSWEVGRCASARMHSGIYMRRVGGEAEFNAEYTTARLILDRIAEVSWSKANGVSARPCILKPDTFFLSVYCGREHDSLYFISRSSSLSGLLISSLLICLISLPFHRTFLLSHFHRRPALLLRYTRAFPFPFLYLSYLASCLRQDLGGEVEANPYNIFYCLINCIIRKPNLRPRYINDIADTLLLLLKCVHYAHPLCKA